MIRLALILAAVVLSTAAQAQCTTANVWCEHRRSERPAPDRQVLFPEPDWVYAKRITDYAKVSATFEIFMFNNIRAQEIAEMHGDELDREGVLWGVHRNPAGSHRPG
jgi:hypothetical protein